MASDFNKYAQELDSYAKGCREALTKAYDAYCVAEKRRLDKGADPVKRALAEADYQQTKAEYDALRRKLFDEMDGKVFEIRNRLSEALSDFFSANPAKLDSATLELLKSGILKPHEYQRLMNAAIRDDNPTMMRVIAQYANQAAEEETKSNGGKSNDKAKALRAVAYQARYASGDIYLSNFDGLTDTLRRCVKHYPSSLFDSWESLTGEAIDHF